MDLGDNFPHVDAKTFFVKCAPLETPLSWVFLFNLTKTFFPLFPNQYPNKKREDSGRKHSGFPYAPPPPPLFGTPDRFPPCVFSSFCWGPPGKKGSRNHGGPLVVSPKPCAPPLDFLVGGKGLPLLFFAAGAPLPDPLLGSCRSYLVVFFQLLCP